MIEKITAAVSEAERDPECRGVVVASGQPGIFSAGLDITEMHKPDANRLPAFWSALQEMWMKLSCSPLATVAAVEGHSPAGGCMLAMSCDWRVMSTGAAGKPFTIGLNETKLGIVAPSWFTDTMAYTIGARRTDHMLQTGALVTAEQAAAMGLVDEAVAHDQVLPCAVAKMAELLSVPDPARHASKLQLRQPIVDALVAVRQQDVDHFCNFIFLPQVQKSLDRYMEALKARSKK